MAPLLLTTLQVQANAEGLTEVTVAQLAGILGSSERQIQRLLRLLETSGAITALRKSGGRGKPAQYRLSPQGGDSPSPAGRGGQGG
jgi:predicted ArsR family transcriptional regulator